MGWDLLTEAGICQGNWVSVSETTACSFDGRRLNYSAPNSGSSTPATVVEKPFHSYGVPRMDAAESFS